MEENIFNISALLSNGELKDITRLKDKPIMKCANDDPSTITQPYPPSGAVVSCSRSPSYFSLPDYGKKPLNYFHFVRAFELTIITFLMFYLTLRQSIHVGFPHPRSF